jgi:YegS/Rv2252/BmrU family lipid kinase
VNGIVRSGLLPELATIPLGTGMDFIRSHDIPKRFDDAVRIAIEGATSTIDVGRVTYAGGERYFANVSTVGMSGAVARRANGMSKALGGRITFFYALAREFATWKNTRVEVRLDDGSVHAGPMHDVIVANGTWHGGAMKLAPDALADDGLFEVQTIGDVNKLDFVRTAPKLYSGKHLSHPKVDAYRSSWVEVDADEPLPIEVDGETVGTTPARWEIVPRALRLRVAR